LEKEQAPVEARGLTVRYRGTRVPALRAVDLEVARGEVVGLLGESGAGKTTLALALLGLLPASADMAGHLRRDGGIGLVFQEPALALNPVLRAGFQLTEVLRAHGGPRGRAGRTEAARRFEEMGLRDTGRFLAAYPHELSGGQRQRVALAQALAGDPALVVADEPTAALDPTLRAEVLAVLEERRRSRGLALLFITHQPRLLAGWADRVIVLYAGEVVEEGPAAEVLGDPKHPYTRGLLRALPPPLTAHTPRTPLADPSSPRTPLLALPGDPPGLNRQPEGCPFEPRCADRLDVCRTGAPGSYAVATAGVVARRARCFKYGA
jgi:oligopeptide/dipeptide ABC transporter ATP-binding protein